MRSPKPGARRPSPPQAPSSQAPGSTRTGTTFMSSEEEDYGLRAVVVESATTTSTLAAVYAKYLSIAGPPEVDGDGRLTCENCRRKYLETENHDEACVWYTSEHKGMFLTDYESDAWYGWHEANPPMTSSYWKDSSTGWDGKHRSTGCGCTHANDECERTGRHIPEGHPPSADEWVEPESGELSDDEFGDFESCEKNGQTLLLKNYIRSCVFLIKEKLGAAGSC